MSFVTVPDKNTGDTFTEVMWDSYIKDNINTALWHPLADTTLAAAAATIVLSGIPSTMTHLAVIAQLQDDDPAATGAETRMRFNGDAGNNYDSQQLTNNAATTLIGVESYAQNAMLVGAHSSALAPAGSSGGFMAFIPQYNNTSFQKSVVSFSGYKLSSAANGMNTRLVTGHWRNTSSITSVTIVSTSAGSFVVGSRVIVYGMGVV